MIYYSVPTKDELNYIENINETFRHAVFFNHLKNGEYNILNAKQVNIYLNQCRVGLCLSEWDGAQYASIQYLLAGIPVVETKSHGGRDVFFDRKYTVRVEPTVESVTKGVAEMIKRNIPPAYIRQKTLEKMQIHRQNFISLIQGIYEQNEIKRNFLMNGVKSFLID